MPERNESTLEDVARTLRGARYVTALCHENPDADTLGAAIAISILAERLGAVSEVVSVDVPAPVFDFLPRIDSIRQRPGLPPDVAVVCDAATLERVGPIATDAAEWLRRSRLINIDHHVSSDFFGDINLVESDASATCQIVAQLATALGLEFDRELATPLLTGLLRDSHGFADRSTSADTLRVAAHLVDAGAPLADIHRAVLSELPFSTMALWGQILSDMRQACHGRVTYSVLLQRTLDETCTQQHDADGIVEFMANARGSEVTLLLRELGQEETRVSIRTSDRVDASEIAAIFEGGGHARRAGCTIPLAADRALEMLLTECSSRVTPASQ